MVFCVYLTSLILNTRFFIVAHGSTIYIGDNDNILPNRFYAAPANTHLQDAC